MQVSSSFHNVATSASRSCMKLCCREFGTWSGWCHRWQLPKLALPGALGIVLASWWRDAGCWRLGNPWKSGNPWAKQTSSLSSPTCPSQRNDRNACYFVLALTALIFALPILNCSLYGQSDGLELGTVDFFLACEFSVLCDDTLVGNKTTFCPAPCRLCAVRCVCRCRWRRLLRWSTHWATFLESILRAMSSMGTAKKVMAVMAAMAVMECCKTLQDMFFCPFFAVPYCEHSVSYWVFWRAAV